MYGDLLCPRKTPPPTLNDQSLRKFTCPAHCPPSVCKEQGLMSRSVSSFHSPSRGSRGTPGLPQVTEPCSIFPGIQTCLWQRWLTAVPQTGLLCTFV